MMTTNEINEITTAIQEAAEEGLRNAIDNEKFEYRINLYADGTVQCDEYLYRSNSEPAYPHKTLYTFEFFGYGVRDWISDGDDAWHAETDDLIEKISDKEKVKEIIWDTVYTDRDGIDETTFEEIYAEAKDENGYEAIFNALEEEFYDEAEEIINEIRELYINAHHITAWTTCDDKFDMDCFGIEVEYQN